MDAPSLQRIAAWSGVAAWSLLPQAVTAVALTVLATQRRLQLVVVAYGAGLLALLLAAPVWLQAGRPLLWRLHAVYAAVGAMAGLALGQPGRQWVPLRSLGGPLLVTLAAAAVAHSGWMGQPPSLPLGLLIGGAFATLVLLVGWLSSADLRRAMRT